jgi:hypothetical protein
MPPLEPILASGAALARCPKPGYTVMVLLDALQPAGVSTLVLDPYSLMPAMGAAAGVLPMASVQVLESGSFVSLATVVSPVGHGRFGRPVLRLRLEREDGGETVEGEVRFGQMVVVPLGQGQHARLTLRPERGFDVGFGGPGRAGVLRVTGGAVGLVVDGRGRPMRLPVETVRRVELIQKWMWISSQPEPPARLATLHLKLMATAWLTLPCSSLTTIRRAKPPVPGRPCGSTRVRQRHSG